MALYTIDHFQRDYNVSRETLGQFRLYHDLLLKWQKRINLIAPSTIHDIWGRHMADSAQIFQYIQNPQQRIVDIGSGAGFPGMVLALLGCQDVTLIESDQRKCAFLREVARQTGAQVQILNARIQDVAGDYDVVTARALAPLADLLTFVEGLTAGKGKGLFLKGQNLDGEIQQALQSHKFSYQCFDSCTNADAGIVAVNVSRET